MRGWWGNKPPPQRVLIALGGVLSIVLIVGGLYCIGRSGTSKVLPELGKLLTDTGKGTLLGTLGLAVINDVTSWSGSWKALRASASGIRRSVDRLVDALSGELTGLGTVRGVSTTYLRDSAAHLRAVEVVFNTLHKSLLEAGDWNELTSRVDAYRDSDALLKEFLAADARVEEYLAGVAAAVGPVTESLLDARSAVSPLLSDSISELPAKLNELPVALRELCTFLSKFVASSDDAADRRRAANLALHVSANLYFLRTAIDLLQYEANFGIPFGYRSGVRS